MSPTIVVDNNGTELAYIDSGPPASGGVYSTIFAVHGVVFAAPIFQKVSSKCREKGVRFVSIIRRGYKGSTPFPTAAIAALPSGTDAEKIDFMKQRGLEIARFVDTFIQREQLHPISADGKTGGVALLGWSAGATFTASAIANVSALPPPVQARLASHLRVHMMQEPPSLGFGLPIPPQTYAPEIDTCIPEKSRTPTFTRWITSYFQHGDLSTRDLNVIDYALPTMSRMPSIWNMTQSEIADIVDETPYTTVDTPMMLSCMPQAHAIYETATFDKTVRDQLPHMQVWELTGDATASFALAALWSIEADDKARGGNHVRYKMVPGANHFMHWDDPETSVETYLATLVTTS